DAIGVGLLRVLVKLDRQPPLLAQLAGGLFDPALLGRVRLTLEPGAGAAGQPGCPRAASGQICLSHRSAAHSRSSHQVKGWYTGGVAGPFSRSILYLFTIADASAQGAQISRPSPAPPESVGAG